MNMPVRNSEGSRGRARLAAIATALDSRWMSRRNDAVEPGPAALRVHTASTRPRVRLHGEG